MSGPAFLLSGVSQGQNRLVNRLLGDLARLRPANLHIIVTENNRDSVPPDARGMRLDVIANATPTGDLAQTTTPRLWVVNPDIRITEDPFPALRASDKGPLEVHRAAGYKAAYEPDVSVAHGVPSQPRRPAAHVDSRRQRPTLPTRRYR